MKRLIFGKGKVSSIIGVERDLILSRRECDITNLEQVIESVRKFKPDLVINCAAKTNLEYCQENKIEAYRSNVVGVSNLIEVCSRSKIKFAHISSGCLFDGNEVISYEDTTPTPAAWYTYTKHWADEYIKNFGYENYLILRPRQMISKTPHPTNMITKFSNLEYIPAIEEENSVTCIEDFGEMIQHLARNDLRGIFNCCNAETITPYAIALKIKKYINKELKIDKVSYEELLKLLPNKRVNTVLSCEKLKSTGYHPRSAEEALDWVVKNYG